jgi:hypothetical protein
MTGTGTSGRGRCGWPSPARQSLKRLIARCAGNPERIGEPDRFTMCPPTSIRAELRRERWRCGPAGRGHLRVGSSHTPRRGPDPEGTDQLAPKGRRSSRVMASLPYRHPRPGVRTGQSRGPPSGSADSLHAQRRSVLHYQDRPTTPVRRPHRRITLSMGRRSSKKAPPRTFEFLGIMPAYPPPNQRKCPDVDDFSTNSANTSSRRAYRPSSAPLQMTSRHRNARDVRHDRPPPTASPPRHSRGMTSPPRRGPAPARRRGSARSRSTWTERPARGVPSVSKTRPGVPRAKSSPAARPDARSPIDWRLLIL